MKCPCIGCKDRNAVCHTKGKCPHGFEDWKKEQLLRKEIIRKAKAKDVPHWTKAQETRHFDYIKHGQEKTR